MNQLLVTGHDLSNICRVCLTGGGSMTDIFCFSSAFGKSVADILMECAPVQNITRNERMPNYICQLCHNQLENVHKFQTQAVQAEKTLLEYLQQLDSQSQTGCSNKISCDDSGNQISVAHACVKVEIVEPADRFNEDNCEEASESSHEEGDNYEKKIKKTQRKCHGLIKQESKEDDPFIETSNVYNITENFKNLRSTEGFYYQDNDKKAINYVIKPAQSETTLQLDASDSQNQTGCSNEISSDYSLNQISEEQVTVKVESIEPSDRFNEDNYEETTEGSHGQQNEYFEKIYLKAEKDIQIKQENIEVRSLNESSELNDNEYIPKICENQRSTDETETFQENDKKGKNSVKKIYQCNLCSKSYTQLHNLKSHQRTHTGEKPYQCDVCTKGFVGLDSLNKHKIIHTGEKPYQCDVCNKRFTQSSNLRNHKLMHSGVKPYQCDICNKRFTQLTSFNRHKAMHTGKKPYQCDVCNKCFTESGHLKSHKVRHSGVKPYQCDICHMSFIESRYLKYHKRTHTDEKPYKCDVCNKGCVDLHSLTRHKLTHTGEKPYKCDVCGKCFSQSGNLNSHKLRHSSVKAHKCDVCNKCFVQLNSLIRHKLIHVTTP